MIVYDGKKYRGISKRGDGAFVFRYTDAGGVSIGRGTGRWKRS